jgi:hypothetical protein
VPLTIVLISEISTLVNGTLLNFGKRYEDNLRFIFDQWPKLHLDLDDLCNQKTLKCIFYVCTYKNTSDKIVENKKVAVKL